LLIVYCICIWLPILNIEIDQKDSFLFFFFVYFFSCFFTRLLKSIDVDAKTRKKKEKKNVVELFPVEYVVDWCMHQLLSSVPFVYLHVILTSVLHTFFDYHSSIIIIFQHQNSQWCLHPDGTLLIPLVYRWFYLI